MRFVSKRREARYVMKPTDRVIDEQRRVSIIRGKTVEFRNHRYETNDPEVIDFLTHHPEYGFTIMSAEPGEKVQVQKPAPLIIENEDGGVPDTAVPMIHGARSTESKPIGMIPSQSAVITKDEVVQLVDERMKSLDNKLDNLILALSGQKAIEEAAKVPKAKKEFHCPICHEQFPSGIAVGRHKKEVHPSN